MIHYAKQEFERDIEILAQQIKNSGIKYTALYGISPVVYELAKVLHLPVRSGLKTNPMRPSRILVVNDIVGTGTTRDSFDEFDFACLHIAIDAKPKHPINYAAHVGVSDHIHYFWEDEKEEVQQDELATEIKETIESIDKVISDKYYIDSFTINIKRKS